jgi:hypothetical protein
MAATAGVSATAGGASAAGSAGWAASETARGETQIAYQAAIDNRKTRRIVIGRPICFHIPLDCRILHCQR